MKRLPLSLALVFVALHASAEDRTAKAIGTSTSSTRSSSYSDGSGNTVTTTTTERDGKRETRRIVTGPNGKVLSETTGEDDPAANPKANPAAENSKPGGPWLGVHTTELAPALREQLDLPADTGLLVDRLPPDSPAASAGIAQNDILLTLNFTSVATPEQLRAALAKFQPGEQVLVEYMHKARREKVTVTLGKRATPENSSSVPPAGSSKVDPGSTFPAGTAKAQAKSSTRTVIVGSDGKAKIIETEGEGDPFAEMLRDPNVPAMMKESLRKMQERMRDLQHRTQDGARGSGKAVEKGTQ